MEILAFLGVAALVSPKADEAKLPIFKTRSWFKPDRLDVRPVAWSLRNHPEEWQWKSYYNGTLTTNIIVHLPSKHEFWVYGKWFTLLWDANCSCTSSGGQFQPFQRGMFWRAFKSWRRSSHARVQQERQAAVQMERAGQQAEQFASHFMPHNGRS